MHVFAKHFMHMRSLFAVHAMGGIQERLTFIYNLNCRPTLNLFARLMDSLQLIK